MQIYLTLWGGTPAPHPFLVLPVLLWAFWLDVAAIWALVWTIDWRDGGREGWS